MSAISTRKRRLQTTSQAPQKPPSFRYNSRSLAFRGKVHVPIAIHIAVSQTKQRSSCGSMSHGRPSVPCWLLRQPKHQVAIPIGGNQVHVAVAVQVRSRQTAQSSPPVSKLTALYVSSKYPLRFTLISNEASPCCRALVTISNPSSPMMSITKAARCFPSSGHCSC